MTMEKATAMMQAGTLMATGVPMMWDIISARPMPVATPRMPPMLVSTAASVRNCQRMRLCWAPMAIFRPISRVRSVTDTSMMFITPMPPTTREMAAIQISCLLVDSDRLCRSLACWRRSLDSYLYLVVRMTFSFRYLATLSPAAVMSLVLVARTAAYCGSSYR